MSGAAVALVVRNPAAFLAAWDVAPAAVAQYVTGMGEALLQAQREVAPVGKRMVHPDSKHKKPRGKGGSRTMLGSLRILKRSGRGFSRTMVVGTTLPQAQWVTFGTRPHPIEHRRAKVLTIFAPWHEDADEHGFIFRRKVNHPGITKLNPWREKAANFVLAWRSADLWRKAVERHMQSVAVPAPEIEIRGEA